MASFDDDEKPVGGNTGVKDGLVKMKEPVLNRSDVGLTEGRVTAIVEIKATSSAAVREGLDLVAVLDVSGSMGGEKIESMKRALQFVIIKLTPADRLSIVTFSTTAKLESKLRRMTEAAKSDLKNKVQDLVAEGYTDIKAGLDMGLAVISGRKYTKFRTANIFLMSDGCPYLPGATQPEDPTKVDPGEVAVYTFGFGAGTDHQLLTSLAKKSTGGTYSAVPDGANLSAPFAQLLGGLMTVVAQDVRVILERETGDDDDVKKMTVADGTDYTATTDDKSGVTTIKFGTLFSGESRKVTIIFDLKDVSEEETDAYNTNLAKARHSYAAQEVPQPPMFIATTRTPTPTPFDPAKAGPEERSVQAEKLRRMHADTISEASSLAHAKKPELLDKARERILDGHNAVGDIVLDDGDKMLKVLRAELMQLLAYMGTQDDYDKLGHPYALATIMSHRRERTAGRGDEDKITSLYTTPRMIAYLDQANKFELEPDAPVPSAEDDLEQEINSDPLAAISDPLAFYLDAAIQALQSIKKVLADASQRKR